MPECSPGSGTPEFPAWLTALLGCTRRGRGEQTKPCEYLDNLSCTDFGIVFGIPQPPLTAENQRTIRDSGAPTW